MDVFGTVVSAIQLANKLIGYLQAIKGAHEDCLKLLSEVSVLGALLGILRRRLDDTSTYGNGGGVSNRLVKIGIKDSLDQCYHALERTVAELERVVPQVRVGEPPFSGKMKRLKWPFHQGGIRATIDRIGRLTSLISLAFQTSLMEFIDKAYDELAVVGLNVKELRSVILALEADQSAHMKKTESLQVDLTALGFKLQSSANGIARIENMVAMIDRNQHDQRVKGSFMQADLAIIKEGQKLQEILNWLSPPDFSGKHNTVFERHASGTGEWFLNHPKFLAWQKDEYNVLWCPGGPGVGKSVMTSAIIRRLQGILSEGVAVVFIYFEYTTKYTITQLIEAVLSQLIRRRITRSGMESLQSHMAGSRPTLDELIGILKTEAEGYTRVFVVVDALDEADIEVWAPLLRRLRALSGIKLLATSRDIGEIALEFSPDQSLNIVANEGDMKKYIEGRLSGSTRRFKRLLEANPSLREEIVTSIMKKADGMFLLARLHMDSLEKKANTTDLRRALAELPGDLNATYDETIGRISDRDKPLAYHIFSWLMHAARPMTIRDLQHALAVKEGKTAIDPDDLYDEAHLISVCAGLVVLQGRMVGGYRRGKVVGLAHYTTQEYLCNHTSPHFPHPTHLAIACLRYLSCGSFRINGSEEWLAETPFAEYAILSWGEHARMHCDDTAIRDLAMQLLHDDRWVVMVGSLPCQTKNPSAIHLCAYFGLEGYLGYLLDNGFDVNSKDSEGDTALAEAAVCGRVEIMQLLLAREGVNVNSKGIHGNTPLSWATMYGQQGIVELLLARDDVDINSRNNGGTTPIASAAQHGNTAIVEQLLARSDLDASPRDSAGGTPICYATLEGHSSILKLLLARDSVDINSPGLSGRTPLASAILHEVNDDAINSRDSEGNTTENPSAQRGHGVLELLLSRRDVDINARGQDGYTPLLFAIRCGHEAIVQLLLARNDLDVNRHDNFGNTPIIIAVWFGYSGIIELLLARDGVDINSRGEDGHTPLSAAAHLGYEAIVRLLLARNDLDVNPRNDLGDTPIIIAARRGYGSIVRLLLSRDDVDVNLRGQDGRTPLLAAIMQGDEAIVQLLLARTDLDTSWRSGINLGATYLSNSGEVSKWLPAKGNMDANRATGLRGALGQ